MEHELVEQQAACDDCGGRIQLDQKDLHCVECGLVSNEPIFGNPVSKFDDNGRMANPGNSAGALGSEFWVPNGVSFTERAKFSRMQREQKRIVRNKTNGKADVIRAIKGLGSRLEMSRVVVDQAIRYALQARAKRVGRGIAFSTLAAASLALSAKVLGHPRSMKEIVAVLPPMDHATSRVNTARKKILRVLRVRVPQIDPVKMIPVFIEKLNLPPEVEIEVRKALAEIGNSGGSPMIDLAVSFYVACIRVNARGYEYLARRRTQEEIGEALGGVSEVSIRSRLKKFFPAEMVE